MANFVFSPNWFYCVDTLISFFSMISLLLITMFSYKFYKLNKEKKLFLHLSLAFGVLSLSYVALFAIDFLIYFYQTFNIDKIEVVSIIASQTINGVRNSYWFFAIGASLFRFLNLVGLYMLYVIYKKRLVKTDTIIMFTCFFLITYFSHNSYFAFHVLALIFLSVISHIYYKTYRKNKKRTTFFLMEGFMALSLSQLIFIFKTINPMYYVVAQSVQLLGYFSLLLAIILVIKHGKKKK